MLARRATAYDSSCSWVDLVYLHPFRRNSLLKCALQPKVAKNTKIIKSPPISGVRVIDGNGCAKLQFMCLLMATRDD